MWEVRRKKRKKYKSLLSWSPSILAYQVIDYVCDDVFNTVFDLVNDSIECHMFSKYILMAYADSYYGHTKNMKSGV